MKEYLNYASDSSSTHAAPMSDSDEESDTDLSEWFIYVQMRMVVQMMNLVPLNLTYQIQISSPLMVYIGN